MPKLRVWSLAIGGIAVVALVVALWPTATWPDARARVEVLPAVAPAGFGVRRVALDPGHGARENTGNRSAFCVDEQDFTLSLGEHVAARLERTGNFEVLLTRRRGEAVEYAERISRAEAWGAEALISFHSDVRGRAAHWEPRAGVSCPRSRSEPGFAVIYSDDAEPALLESRHALALALGRTLEEARFVAYDGPSYARDYQRSGRAGVFLDRRPAKSRIFVLHRPRVTSVLVETHNAIHDLEAVRWDDPETRDAFAAAVARALIAALSGENGDRRKALL